MAAVLVSIGCSRPQACALALEYEPGPSIAGRTFAICLRAIAPWAPQCSVHGNR